MLVEVILFPLTLVGGAFGTAITLKSYENHSTYIETGTRVTAFSRTSLFLERFWREFRISKSHKPVSKTYRPKNDNFCLLMMLRFLMSYTSDAFIDEAEIPFSREKVPQNGLKINGSVKTP